MDKQTQFGRTPNAQAPKPQIVNPAEDSAADAKGSAKGKPRKKRAHQNQIVVFFNFMFSSLILVLLAAGAAMYLGKAEFEKAGPLVEESTYTVRPGATVGQIASGLRGKNIIANDRIFQFGVRAYGNQNSLKAGEYAFESGASMKSVMETLVSGRAVQHSVTIVEGITVQKAFERIAANPVLTGEMPTTLPPEGSLIADTVLFQRGMDRQALIDKMIAAQTNLVEEIWAKRQPDLPLNDINEFVTLASIVEKETGVASERPMVAGVFVNRLRQGIRLQSDPTIIYGIFGGAGKPADRPIYRSDIDRETPYNTYTIDRLPPGPIAIPGRASLEAVANPANTSALFFVADGTGGHAFADTLAEHNENVRKWREIEKQKENQAN